MENPSPTIFLNFPYNFNEEKLVSDLYQLLKSEWVPHFNKEGYVGNWNSIALYSAGGNQENI